DLVDAVEDVRTELDGGGFEVRLPVLQRARADDHTADRRVVERERNGQLSQRPAVVLRQPGQRVGGGQFALVALEADVEPAGDEIGARRLRLLATDAVLPGKPTGGQRTVAEHADAVLARDGEDLALRA